MEQTGVTLLTESMGKVKGEQGAHTMAEECKRLRALRS
jgi:hypothetical protein